MQLQLLHLDNALKSQPQFLAACRQAQARETEAADIATPIRLWGKNAALEPLQARLRESMPKGERIVTFMGSGDFHHVSALLIGALAERSDAPLTVLHFDNHPDWVRFDDGLHCGSWVNRAMALPQVKRVITLGVCSDDLRFPEFKGANLQAMRDGRLVLLPFNRAPSRVFKQHGSGAGYAQRGRHIEWNNLEHMPQESLEATLATLISTRNIYITIDKDVLAQEDALTNWDQGRLPLARLLSTLRFLLAHHHAIGIDITGDYSQPHYAGRARDMLMKKLETLMDQPRGRIDAAHAAAVNQKSNLALLDCLREAA